MQSQGSGVPESRYTMSYSHSALTGDGVDIYGHSTDPYVLHNQHHIIGHGGPPGMSPTGHGIGMGSPGQHHQHSSKRSADVAGLNLKQDPMVGDVTMSTIGMGHSTMDDGGSGAAGGQNGAQAKKTPPPNGKKTKGRVKIKMEFIDNKLRRYTTFSKRKTGIMKKAYELSTLTGTQVMLLVASETGHVYTFATRKLQPMITSEAGKALIQTCLNSPDPPSSTVDQRMSATGFEETELTYTLHDEDQKDSESDDGDEAASSDGASRSPSPADMERSYSPGDRPVEPAQHVMHSTPSRVVNPSRGLSSGGGGGGGTRGSAAITAESSQQQQSVSYQLAVNGSRHVHAAATATTAPSTTASSSSATTIAATTTNLASSSNGHLSCPVNLTPSQLASIAANLPGLSGLSLPLPHGTNFASLLASASSLLTGVGAVGGALGGGGLGSAGVASKSPSSSETTRKHLPRLISLAHMGAALQQQPNSAKDAAITSKQQTTNLMADQRNDSSALNLQTGTTSVATRDKKGGGGGVAGGSSNKSRASTKKNKK